jgi:hypothetical protein
MLVRFTSNASTTASGWSASYTSTIEYSGPCINETFANLTGTVTDNSGADNYVHNMACRKLIQPAGVINLVLAFTQFNTESGYDFVRVYNGSTTSAPLLGQFSGNSLPSSVTATNGSMLITFTSDNSVVGSGWSANYTTNNDYFGPCINETFTGLTGTVTDNSGSGNYVNNMDCQKLIQPVNAASITLSFSQFNTESGYDFVRVYDGATTSAPLLGQYSGTNLPPSLTSTGGSMLIRFTSDYSVVAQGWTAQYVSSLNAPDFKNIQELNVNEPTSGIDEVKIVVYPNPVGEMLTIESNYTDDQVFTLELTNTSGQTVLYQRVSVTGGKYDLDVSTMDYGLYILRIMTRDHMELVRIVKR